MHYTHNSFDNFTSEKKYNCNWRHQYFCCTISTCNICICKKCFKAYDQNIINYISLTDENENCNNNSEDDNDLQEPYDKDDDVNVD